MTRRTRDIRHVVVSGQVGVMVQGGVMVLALVLVGAACSGPRAPSPPLPSASAPPAPSSAPPPLSSRGELPQRPPPEPLPDGCATAVPSGLAPRVRLEAVARACARGMQPLAAAPRVGTLETGAALELPFSVVDARRCVRAAAAGSAGIEELALEVLAEDDRVLGADQLPGALALANPDGPICASVAGKYRAIARAVQGRGEVALQVWQAE